MIHASQIKIAFANMMRMAARDPLWAIVAFITFPLRYAKSFVMGAAGYLFVVFTVYFGIDYLRRVILGGHRGDVIWHIGDWVVMAFAIVLLIRLLSVPLITHFGSATDDTHGSARFAGRREIAPLTKAGSGLLIGRAPGSARLLRYDGPAHLLTMAPTRSGKGVGTIIPNLLTADRSIICIDPKGENAQIAGDAREKFGPVHILDPFGITSKPTAAFNPMDGVDKDSVGVAEDATTLADALVFDEPGLSGDAHWNEEAKALIAGLLLHVIASQPDDRRTLTTLRHVLTLAPEAFRAVRHEMQASDAVNGLIARAANRHLGKSDREASGVSSAAQRHTHFLDAYGFAALAPTIVRAANGGLQWRYFQADAAGFGRTPVLLTSEREAILIDGGFTLPFGRDGSRETFCGSCGQRKILSVLRIGEVGIGGLYKYVLSATHDHGSDAT